MLAGLLPILLALLLPLRPATAAIPASDLGNYQILLVGGIYNELIPGYFTSFEKFLRKDGATDIARMMPSSRRSVAETTDQLADEIVRLHQHSKKPVVVFGHSMGGVRLINAMGSRAKDLPPEVLTAAIPVNSPLKGSPATDQLIRRLRPFSPMYVLLPSYQNNIRVLESISAEGVKKDFAESYKARTPEEIKAISDRVFYVRSVESPGKVSLLFRDQARHLEQFGPSDGLVPAESQMLEQFQGLERFGTDTGVIPNRDHMALFKEGNTNEGSQAEVFRGIFREIARRRGSFSAPGCAHGFSSTSPGTAP